MFSFVAHAPLRASRANTTLSSSFSPLSAARRPRALRPSSRRVAAPSMQVWSDPAVTQEYFDYLEGRNQREPTGDCRSTIVGGGGRIGSLLSSTEMNDVVLSRGDPIPADAPGPIYVCTRNNDLDEVIASCPDERRDDLVFMQNGFLERYLRQRGVSDNTQANLYCAVAELGKKPVDGITEEAPEGLTRVCGKWEGAFTERLESKGLTCKVVKERDFRRSQLEKLIWISVFNLIGAVHGNITMGEVARMHTREVTEMSVELAQMVRFTLTVGMLPDIEKRLLAYARVVKDFPTGIKEFKWRNGFFYDYSLLARKKGFPDPSPMHTYVHRFQPISFELGY